MDCGALAWSRSPSKVVMEATRLVRPEGSATISSPGRMVPAAIWPAKPRKCWSGRMTRWMGRRKPLRQVAVADGDLLEMLEQRGAGVPGHAGAGLTTLSPSSALTGMVTRFARCRTPATMAWRSVAIWL